MALAGAPGAAELERVELQLCYVDIEFQSLWPKFKLDSYGEPPHHQTQWPFSIANASIAREYSALIGALLHEVTLKSHFFPQLSLVNPPFVPAGQVRFPHPWCPGCGSLCAVGLQVDDHRWSTHHIHSSLNWWIMVNPILLAIFPINPNSDGDIWEWVSQHVWTISHSSHIFFMAHVEKMVTREVKAAKSEGFVKCPEKMIRYIRWT